jgi:hypothetical protein
MGEDALARALRLLDETAAAMTIAVEHCRVAQTHFRTREMARAAAHSWAAQGHLVEARERLDQLARLHASRSTTEI